MHFFPNVTSWLKLSVNPILKPKKDLKKNKFNLWESTSEDSFFEFASCKIKPCGWYMVNLNLTLSHSTTNAKIYIDSGKDYNEEEQLTFPLNSGKLIKRILYLENPPKRLRFDPCEAPMEFSINEFN